ncbi:hypothetical protein Hanom_Chr00s190110g01834561 [Helianthus anomalus]
MKAVLGYKKKQNQKKRFENPNYQKKTNFVHETSSEEEKELQFRRQSNEELYAQKRKQQQVKYVSKRTSFKCDEIEQLSRKCPILKPVDVGKEKKVKTRKSNKFESKQTWKPKPTTPKVVPQHIWKQKVNVSETKQIWKLK